MKTFLLLLPLSFALSQTPKPDPEKELWEAAKAELEPLPEVTLGDAPQQAKIALGKRLYFEKKLSSNETMSCNTCHDLAKFGVDNEPTSPGALGKRGGRNSPTVYNASLHASQFWDGRSPDIESQALGPILNPIEMNMPSDVEVVKRLKSDATYLSEFQKAFPKEKNPLTYANIGQAIGAFERTLLTPAPIDAFLKGNLKALNSSQKKGLKTFIEVGCTSCHQGPAIGGGMYQKFGLVEEYKTSDKGRFEVTKDPEDLYVFKVPSLRNVHQTAPYFHDGSVKSLDEVIKIMGKHQLGVELEKQQITDIKIFLTSLTGKLPQ